MKPNRTPMFRTLSAILGASVILAATPIEAAETDLSNLPLANATTVDILPNIMFILDDSGSMAWDFLPDWVGSTYPRSSNTSLYKNSGFNRVYYNPAVTYAPPVTVNADGSINTTTYPSKSSGWSSVKYDAFGVQGSSVVLYPSQLCPNGSTPSGTSPNQTCNLVGGADFYTFIPGEYCVASNLVECVSATVPTVTHPYAGNLRWCVNANLTTCRATRSSTYIYPRYPALPASATLSVGGGSSTSVSSVKVNGLEIMSGTTTASNNSSTVASRIRDEINDCTTTITGNCQVAGYKASSSGSAVTITAPDGTGTTTHGFTPVVTKSGGKTITASAFSGGVPGSIVHTSIVSTNNSYPYPGSTAKNSSRTDCAGSTCTYSEEMTNFANWFTYYHTRMQMMKTGVSQAFINIRGTPNAGDPDDKNYFHARVGFSTINNTDTADGAEYLAINNFNTTQKSTWFTRLFAISPDGSTPLRKALVKAGRVYAGQIGTDPIQYSCQRNFSILSTDGYYNDSSTSANKMDGSTDVDDQDGDASCSTIKRPSCDGLRKSNTLADVAYYYYHTDLRSSMDNNVRSTGNKTDIDDVATHQHMTTFTIGLGVDGTLVYQDGYKTSTSGDYYNITQGSGLIPNWPDPESGDDQKIDDLWHAAVNGRGTYFSARDPESLVNGLTSALGAMESTTGSGAAAATSNLQPTAGDNYIYIANYRTMNWDGELSAYTLDLSSGVISSTATWQAGALLNAKIGTTGDTDTRAIYTWANPGTKLFTWSALNVTEQAYFNNNQLSQYADWSAEEKTAATGSLLVNFLRGQNRYEDQDRAEGFDYYRLYRNRENTLGDIVHSQPVYVKAPLYDFADAGYTDFKSAQSGRAGTVYVAANDGMLHAFDGTSGQENWAYVPPMMLKDMWRLADRDYATNHRFFLDGPIAVSDANIGGGWKTILVGALGKGGRGYYAMDITNPATPQPLWNFTVDDDPNVGYSYGTPMITKLADGTWVVLVTSGYNNVPEGSQYLTADGKGHLYVLNAATGAVLKDIPTGAGNTGYPSGLARINIKVPNFELDNTALAAYGGDLYGNMWRFDLEAGSASLVISNGSNQPVTAAPELAEIDGRTVLFFGTGRYLGQTDLDNTQTQAFYAVRDDGSSTVGTPDLVQQILSGDSITANDVDWNTSYGWYFNLPSPERVHLDAQIYFGSVIFATTLPSATECQPGGSGKLYIVDYRDGSDIDGAPVVYTYQSPIVGITVAKLPGGTPVIYGITADGGVPQGTPPTLPIGTGPGSPSTGRRVMWRELLN